MTWPQYFDGGWTGPMARLFNVTAIPHTFTIDADGVLREEKTGDASIEGRLKKLIAQARELQKTASRRAIRLELTFYSSSTDAEESARAATRAAL